MKLTERQLRRTIRRVLQENAQQIPDYMQRSFEEYGSFLKSYSYHGHDIGTNMEFVSTGETEYGRATKVKYTGNIYEPVMTIYENPEEGYILVEWEVSKDGRDVGVGWDTEVDWSSNPARELSSAMAEITGDGFLEWLAEIIGDEDTMQRAVDRKNRIRADWFADGLEDVDLQAHPYALD